MPTPVVVVSAVRTAIGAFGGGLKSLRGPHLAAAVMNAAVERVGGGFKPEMLDDVRFGSCLEDIDGLNVARTGFLLAGLPESVPAVTINRVCISGMEATVSGIQQIMSGFADAVLVGGVESMTNAPYVLPDARWGQRLQDGKLNDSLIHCLYAGSYYNKYPKNGPVEWARGKPYIMGQTAEFLAAQYGITREEQDEVAVRSHNNVERATSEGLFKSEIVPVTIPAKKKNQAPTVMDTDEHFRPGMTMDVMSKLPPVFIPKTGTVTAGNASGMNDGAAAMVIMSAAKAEQLGLTPLAVFNDVAYGACAPEIMGVSPVPAVKNLLTKTGRQSCEEYDRIEINEAFAAQYIACERDLNLPREITNVNGSGIGLGHPVGATGARILVSLIHELHRSKKNVGMATLCGGGGVSLAVELARV